MAINSIKDISNLFKFSINDMIDEIFNQSATQKEVITFNQDQLLSGHDATGKTIKTIGGSPYRPFTVTIKRAKGQPTNVVTLHDTGDFYKTFQLRKVSEGYEVIADFNKPDGNILDNFSSEFDFLGLDKESLTELVDQWIFPLLSKMIKDKLKS